MMIREFLQVANIYYKWWMRSGIIIEEEKSYQWFTHIVSGLNLGCVGIQGLLNLPNPLELTQTDI